MLNAEQSQILEAESKGKPNSIAGLSWLERFGYGSGDMAYNIVFQFVNAYLLFYYTDVGGIHPAAVATLFLVVRVLDAICDPIMGVILDKTNTRWGKARPYLLWVSLPFALFTILCFTNPHLGSTGNIIYMYITYILLGMTFSMQTIPVNSLTGRITNNIQERTVLTTTRMILVYVGILLSISCATPLVTAIGGENQEFGFQMTALVYAVVSIILNLFSFFTVRERIAPKKSKKHGLKVTLSVLFKNKPLLVLVSSFLAFAIGFNIKLSTMVYYFTYNVHQKELVFWGTVLFFGAALISNLFIPLFSDKWGRKSVMIVSATVSLISYIGLQFTSFNSVALILFWLFASGFFTTPLNTLAWGMVADCVDYAEWKTGVRADGVVISLMSFTNKLGVALAGSFSAIYLGIAGYVANAEQTVASLNAIKNMNALVPGIFILLSVLIICFYPLTEKTYNKMILDLEKKSK
ncbi:putative glucitol transport protein GutA [Priestia megaterium]|jgi:probable glucitol transport protein GutA|uniref:MFS transporter n=1 Tax=Priestia megaterium TaxID=1404 RepID=UPI00047247D5|nr:MFS transporter [Priestia megaterium]MCM3183700.1 MFS transporter [Priestia megaterium]PFB05875.1 MFS transporter [Priestia megaterium]PFR98005.1 MFS transporter [Priestia megaterium]TCN12411.1 putative glucitol transport protein GutA [Bacillus sp. BK006]